MKKNLFLLGILIMSFRVFAQDSKISTFSDLLDLTLSNGIKVHYPKTGVEIFNKSCKNLSSSDPFYSSDEEPDDGRIKILQLKLSPNNPQVVTVLYTDGPSGDPAFIFAKSNGEFVNTIGGTELFISNNGFVYIQGHTNTSFNKRSKYFFDGLKLSEVKQPFYYVGLKTQTNKAITLYTDKTEKNIVASVPANSEIEVLLAEYSQDFGGKEYFLIKTPFGLVGWYGFQTYNLSGDAPIKGIYYAGD